MSLLLLRKSGKEYFSNKRTLQLNQSSSCDLYQMLDCSIVSHFFVITVLLLYFISYSLSMISNVLSKIFACLDGGEDLLRGHSFSLIGDLYENS